MLKGNTGERKIGNTNKLFHMKRFMKNNHESMFLYLIVLLFLKRFEKNKRETLYLYLKLLLFLKRFGKNKCETVFLLEALIIPETFREK